MAISEVKRTHSADPNTFEDPKIVKISKLALILADKNIDEDTKLACLRLSAKTGIVTNSEAVELLLHMSELVDMMNDSSDAEA